MAANSFTAGVDVLQFDTAPVQGGANGCEKYQTTGRGSDGSFYHYNKSTIGREYFQLTYDCLSLSERDNALTYFKDVAEGTKNDVVWEDHTSTIRTVNFRESRIRWQKTGNNEYSVSFTVEEVKS